MDAPISRVQGVGGARALAGELRLRVSIAAAPPRRENSCIDGEARIAAGLHACRLWRLEAHTGFEPVPPP